MNEGFRVVAEFAVQGERQSVDTFYGDAMACQLEWVKEEEEEDSFGGKRRKDIEEKGGWRKTLEGMSLGIKLDVVKGLGHGQAGDRVARVIFRGEFHFHLPLLDLDLHGIVFIPHAHSDP